jgi:PBS lyase HEAT-like repeat
VCYRCRGTLWGLAIILVCLGLVADSRKTGFAGSQDYNADVKSINDFVHQTFIHGVPYQQVIKYKADDVLPILLKMLADPEEEAARSNVATTLGMLGDKRSVQALIQYFQSGKGVLSPSEYNGKISALTALGFILNKQIDPFAFGYLRESLQLSIVHKYKMEWSSPYQKTLEDRDLQLLQTTIMGLGLSGRPEAAQILVSFESRVASLESNAGSDFVKADKTLQATLKEAIRANGVIQKAGQKGLSSYFSQR